MKILLADDNEKYGKPFSEILRNKGHEVEYVTNKFKLIEYARERVYDLIITDYNMPRGIEGLEAVVEIRKSDADTPIILCSEKFEDIPQIFVDVQKAVEKYPNVRVLTKTEVRSRVNSGELEQVFSLE